MKLPLAALLLLLAAHFAPAQQPPVDRITRIGGYIGPNPPKVAPGQDPFADPAATTSKEKTTFRVSRIGTEGAAEKQPKLLELFALVQAAYEVREGKIEALPKSADPFAAPAKPQNPPSREQFVAALKAGQRFTVVASEGRPAPGGQTAKVSVEYTLVW